MLVAYFTHCQRNLKGQDDYPGSVSATATPKINTFLCLPNQSKEVINKNNLVRDL